MEDKALAGMISSKLKVTEYNNRTKSRFVRAMHCLDDDYNDLLWYIKKLSIDDNFLLDGICRKLDIALPCDNKEETIECVYEKLRKRYKEIGLDINGKDKSYIEVVKGWIKDTDPTSTQARKNKRNIYALCMALDMGIDEIKSFCLKYFLTIPFNFRDRTDVTFFYGINNGKSIVDIFELLDAPILNDDFCSGCDQESSTHSFEVDLSKITDDEVFLDFVKNFLDDTKRYRRAVELLKELYEQVESHFSKLRMIREMSELKRKGNSAQKIETLTGINWPKWYREIKSESDQVETSKRLLPKEVFPKSYLSNLLQDYKKDVENIVNGKLEDVTDNKLRNAIIILSFHEFFLAHELEKNNPEFWDDEEIEDQIIRNFRDFKEQLDTDLYSVGLPETYPRALLDLVILICALQEDPIGEFLAFNGDASLLREDRQ
ncbi:hypothetical protein bpr_IV117 (plasmid) [Butyrivibrio proteoclasticus B316]|uniref:Uncharacterized protein n=1 Tax=Butyrivibrio proteoclasticus (strain ATCC 51982 / DSM 14932 / B316) TaxID=515622 RepID=E0S500_BUTPB|nr:hypothetical protein [Butyrivibrio proteoclasticus]ADL36482.1 hypothetical protein bpr_IV117 [Butyrivibrio proteoclasticus B316]